MNTRAEWMTHLRGVYQYGSPRKVAYVSPQARAALAEAFGDDLDGDVLTVAQFKLRLEDRDSVQPGGMFVLDDA
jgi:hypothetical protein